MIHRLDVSRLPECSDLAVERDWGRQERKWGLLFEVGDVYGADDPRGGLAGTTIATPYGSRVAAISMVLVARRHERRGLATRMTRHALEHTPAATACLTATHYGRPVYERIGFRTTGHITTYLGAFTPSTDAATTRRARPQDLPGVLALDEEVFGAPRRELISRLPAFCERFLVIDGPTGVEAFGGTWRNDEQTVIGPVIAQSRDLALRLLHDLAASSTGTVRLDLPHHHGTVITWAEKHGLTPAYTSAAMTYGDPLPTDDLRLFSPVMQALG